MKVGLLTSKRLGKAKRAGLRATGNLAASLRSKNPASIAQKQAKHLIPTLGSFMSKVGSAHRQTKTGFVKPW